MKQLLFFMAGLFVPPAYAQNGTADIAYAHIAYEAVDNPITIGVENCPCSQLRLSVDTGRLQKGPGDCQYIFTTDNPGKAVFTISKKNGGTYSEAGKVNYQVKPLPLPEAMLGNTQTAVMPVALFKAQLGLTAKLNGFDFETYFKVLSFRMEVIRNEELLWDLVNNSNVFEPAGRGDLSRVMPGDIVTFSNIICRKPGGKTAKLEPFTIKIIP